MKKIISSIGISAIFFVTTVFADHVTVNMYKTKKSGQGAYIGKIKFSDTGKGLLIRSWLFDLLSGKRGFHVHVKPSCDNNALSAGGHFDPQHTGKHLGPYRNGHLGDLPVLRVSDNGKARTVMIAPHLKVEDLKGHAIIIHEGSDNYSDTPEPLGGGGARIACGLLLAS